MQARHFALTAGLALALAKPAVAQVTREETDWFRNQVQTIQAPIRGATGTFSQAKSNEGNPGRALIYDASVRAEANRTNTSAAFVFPSQLFHDVAQDGDFGTLSFSQSLYVDTTDAVSTFATARFLVSQSIEGKRVVFGHEVAVRPLFGQWQTISADDLREDDFARIDLATGRFLVDEHPDFDRDFMRFGIGLGAGVTNDTTRAIRERLEIRVDNLRVTVSPVPEPASSAMVLAGLLIVVAIARHRAARRHRPDC